MRMLPPGRRACCARDDASPTAIPACHGRAARGAPQRAAGGWGWHPVIAQTARTLYVCMCIWIADQMDIALAVNLMFLTCPHKLAALYRAEQHAPAARGSRSRDEASHCKVPERWLIWPPHTGSPGGGARADIEMAVVEAARTPSGAAAEEERALLGSGLPSIFTHRLVGCGPPQPSSLPKVGKERQMSSPVDIVGRFMRRRAGSSPSLLEEIQSTACRHQRGVLPARGCGSPRS